MGFVIAFLFIGSFLWGQDPQALFEDNCSPCHTIGEGDGLGPDLKDIGKRRDRAWIEAMIRDPESFILQNPEAKALSDQYPDADMPNLGLSEEEIQALATFLMKGQQEKSGKKEKPSLPPGDGEKGLALFSGRLPFTHGGPPCIKCHTLKSQPSKGGKLAKSIHPQVVSPSMLQNPPFPLMKTIYTTHSLTQEEVSHLLAFFHQPQPLPGPSFPFPLAGALLFFAGFAILSFIPRL